MIPRSMTEGVAMLRAAHAAQHAAEHSGDALAIADAVRASRVASEVYYATFVVECRRRACANLLQARSEMAAARRRGDHHAVGSLTRYIGAVLEGRPSLRYVTRTIASLQEA